MYQKRADTMWYPPPKLSRMSRESEAEGQPRTENPLVLPKILDPERTEESDGYGIESEVGVDLVIHPHTDFGDEAGFGIKPSVIPIDDGIPSHGDPVVDGIGAVDSGTEELGVIEVAPFAGNIELPTRIGYDRQRAEGVRLPDPEIDVVHVVRGPPKEVEVVEVGQCDTGIEAGDLAVPPYGVVDLVVPAAAGIRVVEADTVPELDVESGWIIGQPNRALKNRAVVEDAPIPEPNVAAIGANSARNCPIVGGFDILRNGPVGHAKREGGENAEKDGNVV